MRKIVIAAVAAFAGMSTTAYAADIYEGSLKDEPVAYTPAPIWTGFYVGGHIGGLWNDSGDGTAFKGDWYCGECYNWREYNKAKFEDDDNDLSLLGGVHIGYNWQDGNRVYGLEGDVGFATGVDYLASLRARLGHVVDDLLIYGTVGVAFVGFDDKVVTVNYGHGPLSAEFSGNSDVGLVVGGGIERKLSSNVSVGLEGLYYFFDDADFSSPVGYEYWCKEIGYEDDNDLFVVRARLSYSLQSDEPTLDSYK